MKKKKNCRETQNLQQKVKHVRKFELLSNEAITAHEKI